MAAKGYCTPDEVAASLSRTLTAPQITQLENIIESAEDWIDTRLGYGYLDAPVVGRYVTSWRNRFYLGPIASVESLQYFGYATDVPFTILDASSGLIQTDFGVRDGTGFLVDYTPMDTVPARIQRAAIVLSAHWLMPTLDPDRFGVKQYAFSGDFSATFREEAIPPEVLELVGISGDFTLA